jgi:hypothetical protein
LPSAFANEKELFTPASYFLAKKLRSKINMYFQMYFFAIFDKQKSVEMVKIFFIMEEAAKSARSKNHCRVSFPIPRHVGDYV